MVFVFPPNIMRRRFWGIIGEKGWIIGRKIGFYAAQDELGDVNHYTITPAIPDNFNPRRNFTGALARALSFTGRLKK